MISVDLARELRDSGLVWRPASGDAFVIDRPELVGDVFTVSDMTIEAHVFDTGTILGFNGTTEWALDSVALEDSLWMPREDQVRALLGGTFRSLSRRGDRYRVDVDLGAEARSFTDAEPANAYARALLALMALSGVDAE